MGARAGVHDRGSRHRGALLDGLFAGVRRTSLRTLSFFFPRPCVSLHGLDGLYMAGPLTRGKHREDEFEIGNRWEKGPGGG